MSGSTCRKRQRDRRPALDVFADEAIREDADVERGLRGVVDDGDAVFLREREDAEDLADAVRAAVRVEMCDRATPMRRPGGRRAAEQRERGRAACASADRGSSMRCQPRGARRCSRRSCPVFGSISRTCSVVPLHVDAAGRSSPAARRRRRPRLRRSHRDGRCARQSW